MIYLQIHGSKGLTVTDDLNIQDRYDAGYSDVD
ncbi:uncharacterized protein METZ01_LOCUS495898 [marine metagenome]|uniref:Uncharacterized protein n=1 Tax=marine metagenome TaxID=408172 RepID=A0A383DFD5_9ZZZZ